MFRYVSAADVPPRSTASSAMRTCIASRSGSENTAMDVTPRSRHARMMRQAISPRFAIRRRFNDTFNLRFRDPPRLPFPEETREPVLAFGGHAALGDSRRGDIGFGRDAPGDLANHALRFAHRLRCGRTDFIHIG